MANKNEPGTGNDNPQTSLIPNDPIPTPGDNPTPQHQTLQNNGQTNPQNPPQETSDEILARESLEREEQDKILQLDFGTNSSALYRQAMARFDPKENEVQLSEHTVYTDREYNDYGYF